MLVPHEEAVDRVTLIDQLNEPLPLGLVSAELDFLKCPRSLKDV